MNANANDNDNDNDNNTVYQLILQNNWYLSLAIFGYKVNNLLILILYSIIRNQM